MSVKVTITIEQDDIRAAVPVSTTYEHRAPLGGSNPRYASDTMQAAVIRAATDACLHLARTVDLRDRGDVLAAAAELLAAVGAPDAA